MIEGSRNAQVTVGTSTQNVLKPKPRKVLSLRNSSTGGQVITLQIGEIAAVLNEGVVLSPGQAWTENTSEGYECWDGSVQAISTAAGGVLSIFER